MCLLNYFTANFQELLSQICSNCIHRIIKEKIEKSPLDRSVLHNSGDLTKDLVVIQAIRSFMISFTSII